MDWFLVCVWFFFFFDGVVVVCVCVLFFFHTAALRFSVHPFEQTLNVYLHLDALFFKCYVYSVR